MLRDVTQRAIFEVLESNEIPYRFLKQENSLVLRDVGSPGRRPDRPLRGSPIARQRYRNRWSVRPRTPCRAVPNHRAGPQTMSQIYSVPSGSSFSARSSSPRRDGSGQWPRQRSHQVSRRSGLKGTARATPIRTRQASRPTSVLRGCAPSSFSVRRPIA